MNGWGPFGRARDGFAQLVLVGHSSESRSVGVLLPDLGWKVADIGHQSDRSGSLNDTN
jgi:hypothetical protein